MMTFLALKNTFLSMILVTWKNFYAKSLGKKLKQKSLKYITATVYFHRFLIFNLVCAWQN